MNIVWNQLASRAALTLSDRQLAQLDRYLDLLLEVNLTMNLTRIDDRSQAEIQHIADALTLLPFLPTAPHRLADIGSGGGVPGIPLAIARADVKVTLVESTQKKAAFLQRAAQTLELTNVSVYADRAEKLAQTTGRQGFNVVTARALAAMDKLAEWCLPLVKPGGKLLAMKGPRIAEELPAAQKTLQRLGARKTQTHAVDLPELQGHVIVEIHK